MPHAPQIRPETGLRDLTGGDTRKTCAVLIWDRPATSREGMLVTRPCGAATRHVLTIRSDTMFAVCWRHEQRLRRAFGPAYANAHTARLTGAELQDRRREAEVTQDQLAARLGVNRSRVAGIEALAEPSRPAVRRYLAALAEITEGARA